MQDGVKQACDHHACFFIEKKNEIKQVHLAETVFLASRN